MKKLLWFIGKLCNHLCIMKLANIISKMHNYIFMGIISGDFAYLGKGVLIQHSSTLHDCDKISIGDKSTIGAFCTITAWKKRGNQSFSPNIFIGENVTIGDNCHITCINKIVIGNGCQLGKMITITDNSHGKSSIEEMSQKVIERPLYSKGPVEIGENVWIGDKATILPNVVIGKGCVIGANTVVTMSVPAYHICVGNPAKIYKKS